MIQPLAVEGAPSDDEMPNASMIIPAARRPITHPTRNEMLFTFAAFEKSMRMTAMIGTGLIATPTAWPRIAPIASPMVVLLQMLLLLILHFVTDFSDASALTSTRIPSTLTLSMLGSTVIVWMMSAATPISGDTRKRG